MGVEPSPPSSAKHTYLLRSRRSGGKLSEFECERLREELAVVLQQYNGGGNGCYLQPDAGGRQDLRGRAREEEVNEERANSRRLQEQLAQQSEKIDRLLAMQEET